MAVLEKDIENGERLRLIGLLPSIDWVTGATPLRHQLLQFLNQIVLTEDVAALRLFVGVKRDGGSRFHDESARCKLRQTHQDLFDLRPCVGIERKGFVQPLSDLMQFGSLY